MKFSYENQDFRQVPKEELYKLAAETGERIAREARHLLILDRARWAIEDGIPVECGLEPKELALPGWWIQLEVEIGRIWKLVCQFDGHIDRIFQSCAPPKARQEPKPRPNSHSATNWLRKNDPNYKPGKYSLDRGK